jgi:hypothetical protein
MALEPNQMSWVLNPHCVRRSNIEFASPCEPKWMPGTTAAKRDKIVTIKGTPARISIKEGGRVSSAAVAALFAYYEKNNRLMDVRDPWTEFFRQLEGTNIRPKENWPSTAVV